MAECLNGCTDGCELFCHERTCNCQEYTSPSLTITKIGVALHVKFALRDGSFSYIDCDINVPTIPTSTRYDGDITDVRNYLLEVKPAGWLEEYRKIELMSSTRGSHRLIGEESWQVKMRMLNRDIVLPRQVVWHKLQCLDNGILFRACFSFTKIPFVASATMFTS